MTHVPTVRLSHLSAAERKAYMIADNKLALNAGWDQEILAIELQTLVDLDFEVDLTGFSLAEIDFVLDEARESQPHGLEAPEDKIPNLASNAICRQDELWELGRHRLICGDARNPEVYFALLGHEHADLIFTDPPY